MVLITTNEELGKLHPAVTRPGRCLAQVEFRPLDHDEVIQWLKAHKVEYDATGGLTIAELYARRYNFTNKGKTKVVGFG